MIVFDKKKRRKKKFVFQETFIRIFRLNFVPVLTGFEDGQTAQQ